MEIERKYLLSRVPENLDQYKSYEIEQAYLSEKPVVRVRKRVTGDTAEYFLTVKSRGLLSHEEVESLIEEKTYNAFLAEASSNIISKTRYLIPLTADKLTIELDIFHGLFDELIMAEVEFPDEAASNKFTPPDYFSDEVTFDNRYHNSNMSHMSEAEISALLKRV